VGYSVGIISGILVFLRPPHYPTTHPLSLTPRQDEILASSIMLGAAIGALLIGPVYDSYGRRFALLFASVVFLLSTFIQTVALTYLVLLVGRSINGLAVGAFMLIAPTFIAELAPGDTRGALVNAHELGISLGICVSFVANIFFTLPLFGGPQMAWRWMYGVQGLPCVLLMGGCLFVLPESPRYLIRRGTPLELQQAKQIVTETSIDPKVVAATLQAIKASVAEEGNQGWRSACGADGHRALFVYGLLLGMFQQFVGVDSLIMYTPDILQASGFVATSEQGMFGVLALGGVKLLTEVAVLFFIDRVGRRPLLLVGGGILVVCNIGLGVLLRFSAVEKNAGGGGVEGGTSVVSLFVFLLILVYTSAFAFSWGSVCWIVVSEMFPLSIRGKGVGVVVVGNRLMSFAVSHTFVSIGVATGNVGTPFFMYGALALIGFVFVYVVLPETKDVALEQVPLLWKKK